MMVHPSVGDVIEALYRRKWSIVIVTMIVAALGIALVLQITPQFRSEGTLIVRFGRSVMQSVDLARASSPVIVDVNARRETVLAQTALLTSPDLASAVIGKLGIGKIFPAITAAPPTLGSPMDAALQRFATAVTVNSEMNGDVLHLSYSNPNPEVAQLVLTTLIDLYLERENLIFSGASYDFQKAQTALANQRFLVAQAELVNFKASTGVSDFDNQMNTTIKLRSELIERLQKAQVSLAEKSERRSALAAALNTVSPEVVMSTDRYRQVDAAQARVNALRSQEREMVAIRGEDWPALRALRASLAEAVAATSNLSAASAGRQSTQLNEVHQTIQLDLIRATADEQSRKDAVALMIDQEQALNKEVADLEVVHAGLLARQREVDIADTAYRSLALHLEDSRIGVSRLRDGISRVAVISRPSLPYAKFSPSYRVLGLIIAAVALGTGLGVALLRAMLDDRLMSPGQIDGLNVPVIATFSKH